MKPFLCPTNLAMSLLVALVLPPLAAAQQNDGARPETPTDTQITDTIEDEFAFDHAVPAHLIETTTDAGIVTLDGTVDNALARDRATEIARTVKGVRAVIGQVSVVPPRNVSPDTLRANVEAALLADPAADSYEVTAAADAGGKVTLRGTVQSWTERELCRKVAMGVAGVTSIVNEIEVAYATDRSDAEIKSEIEESLRWNTLVDDGLIQVETTDGAVTLTGTVGSAWEKNRARQEAWVAGVKAVNDDGLEVAVWARDERMRRTKFVTRGDDEIRDAVQAALRQDPRVASFGVRVAVDGGNVTLRGTVDNLTARRAAAIDARNTVGVWEVDNRLRVRPSTTLDSSSIEKNIRAALGRDPFVDRFEVSVTVRNGVAYLHGDVDTSFERAQAEDVAGNINGVVRVVNNLDVQSDRLLTYDPYIDPWPIHDYHWYSYPWYSHRWVMPFETDAEIREEVYDELWWSPFVDANEVTVVVDDGVATLTGTVDTWSERDAAIENAYEGGAARVINNLRINGREQ